VGSSVSEGNTEALRVSDNNVYAELAGGLEEGEREQIGNENGVDLVLLLLRVQTSEDAHNQQHVPKTYKNP
jgi:hypothetical protein